MKKVYGTEGYAESVREFVRLSQSLDFLEVCREYLPFLPSVLARVLDVGSGAGQNSNALAVLGYQVTAVEPVPAFLSTARKSYPKPEIKWLAGDLPQLQCLDCCDTKYEFILVEGVWHHLNKQERAIAVKRFRDLLTTGGRCAISLRNGPPGLGTRVFPTSVTETVSLFEKMGLHCIYESSNQPSVFRHKENVKWGRLVIEKP